MHPFTDQAGESLASLGEARLIHEMRRWLGRASPKAPFGIGDDCAVVPAGSRAQLLTVDPVIYGEHFDDAVAPQAAGEKLFKRNLSDIAAMGGKPRAALVALAIDGSVRIAWLRAFYRGLAAVSLAHKVPLVGGDVARHRGGIVATLTLVGEAAPNGRILTRSGARRGDAVYVTGVLGGSLKSGHHWRFKPRLEEGRWLATRKEVRSMLDVSDGLAKDLHALCPEGCEAALEPEALPCRKGCDFRAALCDGEDYELAFTLAARADRQAFEAAFKLAFPRTRLSRLGHFVGKGLRPPTAIDLSALQGYEHLV